MSKAQKAVQRAILADAEVAWKRYKGSAFSNTPIGLESWEIFYHAYFDFIDKQFVKYGGDPQRLPWHKKGAKFNTISKRRAS